MIRIRTKKTTRSIPSGLARPGGQKIVAVIDRPGLDKRMALVDEWQRELSAFAHQGESVLRRCIAEGVLPPNGSQRVDEFVATWRSFDGGERISLRLRHSPRKK